MPDINDPQACLAPTRCIDSDHPEIVALAAKLAPPGGDECERALKLYYWTRDSIRYNPYDIGTRAEDFSASATLASGQGWCVPKAALLAALCRASGIPARVGYADVRNHLSTAKLRESMATDIFYFHGYTSLLLAGRWVKATPAFNIELCEKFGLKALEFDGHSDSLYHEYDKAGNRHMEYLHERGEFLDVPVEAILTLFAEYYPGLAKERATEARAEDWERDVALETGR